MVQLRRDYAAGQVWSRASRSLVADLKQYARLEMAAASSIFAHRPAAATALCKYWSKNKQPSGVSTGHSAHPLTLPCALWSFTLNHCSLSVAFGN